MRYMWLSNRQLAHSVRSYRRRHLGSLSSSSRSCFLDNKTNLFLVQNHFSTVTTNGHDLLMRSKQPVVSSKRGVQKAWNLDASGKPLFDETPAPSSADVVVIGGGSLGCSALYHLAKLGVTNTVLVEANKLTAGTTWHTAGLVWDLRPTDTETMILNRTLQVLKGLEEETGVNPGWINNGGLLLATNKTRFNELQRMATLGRSMGIEAFSLDPAETKKLYPLMSVDDLYGSLYCPGCGNVT